MTNNDTPATPGWYPDPAGADDQRWWDGARWTDRLKSAQRRRSRRQGLIAAILLFGAVGGCAAVASVAGDAAEAPARRKASIANDVKLGGCGDTSYGSPRAFGTLVNNSSKMSSYLIEVNFTNAGTLIDSSSTIVNNVAPGQSAEWEVIGFGADSTSVSMCQVVDVSRWAS